MTAAFDMSRLVSRAGFETPTGIDRFELSYASWAIEHFGENLQFLAKGPWGHRRVPGDIARSFVADTTAKWSAHDPDADQTVRIERLIHAIETGAEYPIAAGLQARPRRNGTQQLLNLLSAFAWTPSSVPPSSLFIHVSHSGIHKRSGYDWLAERGHRSLFYVHDLIPLLRPEFCRAGEAARHRTRIQTILRLHRLILCNSQATARTLDEMAEVEGLAQPFTAVLPPGLENTFLRFNPDTAVRTNRPYFVCLGTIEPRKNHALLIEIWRQLAERHGSNAPRLVIVGRRGWDNAHVFSVLDNPTALRGTVIEAPGLGDQSVARLLAGACALLAPSHIEGYGMPVAEALALGTPVIASDIRAHREVSRGRAVLLDTLDGIGWVSAIEAHAKFSRRIDHCEQRHWTWTSHFSALHRLLASTRLAPAASVAADKAQQTALTGVGSCQAI